MGPASQSGGVPCERVSSGPSGTAPNPTDIEGVLDVGYWIPNAELSPARSPIEVEHCPLCAFRFDPRSWWTSLLIIPLLETEYAVPSLPAAEPHALHATNKW